ncbi:MULTISPECIES: IS1-like element transposase [Enterobacteriaceae]|uniref:IS1-like element transposase n=1 Tax=Enterobacteriaceae TaxID=543 RepID=UPI0035AB7CE9
MDHFLPVVDTYRPQDDVTLKMPAFEWIHALLRQQNKVLSLSPPDFCNSAQIVDLAMNNAGIRDTARALHISINAVVRTLKNSRRKA